MSNSTTSPTLSSCGSAFRTSDQYAGISPETPTPRNRETLSSGQLCKTTAFIVHPFKKARGRPHARNGPKEDVYRLVVLLVDALQENHTGGGTHRSVNPRNRADANLIQFEVAVERDLHVHATRICEMNVFRVRKNQVRLIRSGTVRFVFRDEGRDVNRPAEQARLDLVLHGRQRTGEQRPRL